MTFLTHDDLLGSLTLDAALRAVTQAEAERRLSIGDADAGLVLSSPGARAPSAAPATTEPHDRQSPSTEG